MSSPRAGVQSQGIRCSYPRRTPATGGPVCPASIGLVGSPQKNKGPHPRWRPLEDPSPVSFLAAPLWHGLLAGRAQWVGPGPSNQRTQSSVAFAADRVPRSCPADLAWGAA